ncbi:putative aldouronate transport system permease protein [Paenibacillus sp. UNCCL117]|nr:putative aldouronate transport system permease protein [Paenibacillus sp. cl123]SFW43920.1 putative aldouronate transport system permease protein [Paenibacillus sp. UNCCL117]
MVAMRPRLPSGVWTHMRTNVSLYLILLPGLLYYAVFHYIPMYGITIAFKEYDVFGGINGSEWIGLQHFRELFASEAFGVVLRNSMLISLYKIAFNFPVPIVLAVLLNEVRKMAFKRTIQTIVYMPYFLSWVVIAGLVINFLSPSSGVVNMLLKSAGFETINFLADKAYFRSIIVLSDLWHGMGWNTIIFLAALTGVDPQLYEAAKMDGAGRLRQMFHITLPGIRSTIVVLLLMKIGHMMDNGFEQMFLLSNPLVYEVGDVFETYVYRMGLIEARYDYSTAVGLFKSCVGLVLLLLANTMARRFGERGIF